MVKKIPKVIKNLPEENMVIMEESMNEGMENLIELEKWKEKYEREHKLRQEAEGELTIVKTITIDSSPEMREAKKENIKLKKEICELRQDNRKLSQQVEDSIDRMRKAGLI
jgi:predicted RNase H-like nuclease (RuvC/YqgF family)